MSDVYILKPALLHASEKFLARYRDFVKPIKKSNSYDHIFGHYSYNKLILFLQKIQVCEIKNDECFISRNLGTDLPYKHFILLMFVKTFKPPWSRGFMRGTDYLSKIEPRDQNIGVHQSLAELGLFNENLDQDAKNLIHQINKFWYTFADENIQMDIGKEGEEQSYLYEYSETGNKPFHQSYFNQGSGFDLISFLDNDVKKYIEVKASTHNQAFITWNEWQTARETISRNELFEFHFWKKEYKKWMLAIVHPNELSFMGEASKDGHRWKDYFIKFEPFKDKFIEIESTQLKKKYDE